MAWNIRTALYRYGRLLQIERIFFPFFIRELHIRGMCLNIFCSVDECVVSKENISIGIVWKISHFSSARTRSNNNKWYVVDFTASICRNYSCTIENDWRFWTLISMRERASKRARVRAHTLPSAPLFSILKLPCFTLFCTHSIHIHRVMELFSRGNIDGKIAKIASVEWVCVCVLVVINR